MSAQTVALGAQELGEQVGQAAVDRAQAQAGPIAEGQQNEKQRQGMLAGGDPQTQQSDSGLGGFLSTIMAAIAEGGDEVDDAPSDMNDPSSAQDQAHETAQDSQEQMSEGSQEQTAHLNMLMEAQGQMVCSIQSDQESVQNKSQEDFAVMQNIQGMKEEHLGTAAEHYAQGESKAAEFNSGIDGMVSWAADWRQRREKAGVSAADTRENAAWANEAAEVVADGIRSQAEQQIQSPMA